MRNAIIIVLVYSLALSCKSHKQANLLELVKAKSTAIKGELVQTTGENHFSNLPKADTEWFMALHQRKLVEPSYGTEGCPNHLHYYGYLPLSNGYTGAIMAYSICNCCGDDQLILAVVDRNGNIKSTLIVAEMADASECFMQTTTRITGDQFMVCHKEECAILEGKDKDRTSVDSTTDKYTFTSSGKFILQQHDSIYIIRNESLR
jgi:hypothetical protein